MSEEIIYNKNVTYRDDGTMWKIYAKYFKYKRILPIFEKYELNFIPKIIEWNNEGYRYEYINMPTINKIYYKKTQVTQKLVLEMKIAIDDIWKKLYQISIDNLPNGYFIWYNDPHLDNLIWKDDTKELILLDIDSFRIDKYIPISYVYMKMFGQLDEILVTNLIENKYEY